MFGELCYWKSLRITCLLLVIDKFSSVSPTLRVGHYADKPTESAVYCFYKINLKQNILCFNFLWVTDAINDRFLTSLVHLESLITQRSGKFWNKKCWMNECIQALGKNNNPLVVVFYRTIANSFPHHLQLSFFCIRWEQKRRRVCTYCKRQV